MMVFDDIFIYFFAVFSFIVVSVVDFSHFGALKDLIRNSKRLQFCNSKRPKEKIQDDIS